MHQLFIFESGIVSPLMFKRLTVMFNLFLLSLIGLTVNTHIYGYIDGCVRVCTRSGTFLRCLFSAHDGMESISLVPKQVARNIRLETRSRRNFHPISCYEKMHKISKYCYSFIGLRKEYNL